ncbi:PIN domain-containing protein [Pseudomonas aeruginosa]|uniref:PIN domain-containing protein n=1 Tax=Pseudomonas aeruginosa TaxID=287 RepID=UPI0019D11C7D|nr:PIN domain-containing protein [Pseudomonas aeruginosa]
MTEFKVFIDTSIILHLLSADPAKADAAEALLENRPVISVQGLNEVTHVCLTQLDMGWDETARFIDLVRGACEVVPLTEEVYNRARRVAQWHRLPFYEACSIAAAMTAGCSAIYSDSLRHGQIFEESLNVRSPWVATPSPATSPA